MQKILVKRLFVARIYRFGRRKELFFEMKLTINVWKLSPRRKPERRTIDKYWIPVSVGINLGNLQKLSFILFFYSLHWPVATKKDIVSGLIYDSVPVPSEYNLLLTVGAFPSDPLKGDGHG
jgi:hypothetical protein